MHSVFTDPQWAFALTLRGTDDWQVWTSSQDFQPFARKVHDRFPAVDAKSMIVIVTAVSLETTGNMSTKPIGSILANIMRVAGYTYADSNAAALAFYGNEEWAADGASNGFHEW